jgi:hypothetical protein
MHVYNVALPWVVHDLWISMDILMGHEVLSTECEHELSMNSGIEDFRVKSAERRFVFARNLRQEDVYCYGCSILAQSSRHIYGSMRNSM